MSTYEQHKESSIVKLGLNLAECQLIIQLLTTIPRTDGDLATGLLDAMLLAQNCLLGETYLPLDEKAKG